MVAPIIPVGKKIQRTLSTPSRIETAEHPTRSTFRHLLYTTPTYKSFHHLLQKSAQTEFQHFIKNHPFQSLILKPLGSHFAQNELNRIIDSISFELSLYPTGTIPASTNPNSSYSRFAWTRDMANKAFAMIEADCIDEAAKVLYSLGRFNNESSQRSQLVSFHLAKHQSEPRERYRLDTNSHPHIRAAINHEGLMVRSEQGWGHNQLDALGAWLFVTFYLANSLADTNNPKHNPQFLNELDTWLTRSVNNENSIDSIFSVALKTLNRIECWNNFDVGPWEDIYAYKRASSIGICLSAAKEAKKYFTENGYNSINIYDQHSFKLELDNLIKNCTKALEERIPHDGREAIECNGFPSDAALTFLLYPYNPGLSEAQEQAILTTLYENRLGTVGFTRRERDDYVGMDYPYNLKSKGIFSELSHHGHKAAEWTLFDPLLATFYYKKFNDKYYSSGIIDEDILSLAELHLRRVLAQVTKEEDSYIKRYESSNGIKEEKITVAPLVLPEAYWFDSRQNKWRPNENSPLLWSEANFILMMKEASIATNTWGKLAR